MTETVFDKNRVYTALNADEVKVGSKVVIAKNISDLKDLFYRNIISTLIGIYSEDQQDRFYGKYVYKTGNSPDTVIGTLCYLISEPEEKKLKWIDLKIGDVIRNETGTHTMMVTGIDSREEKGHKPNSHILISGLWLDDDDLTYWEKIEE